MQFGLCSHRLFEGYLILLFGMCEKSPGDNPESRECGPKARRE
jgi:hypothetical protein